MRGLLREWRNLSSSGISQFLLTCFRCPHTHQGDRCEEKNKDSCEGYCENGGTCLVQGSQNSYLPVSDAHIPTKGTDVKKRTKIHARVTARMAELV